MNLNREEYNNIVQMLIDAGALELTGFDEKSNQFTYGLTPKCQELFPELWEEHFKVVNELAFGLWQKGIIEMQFASDGVPMVMLTKEAVELKDSLPDEERFFIENLIEKHLER